MTTDKRLCIQKLEELKLEVADVADEIDGIPLITAKRDAAFKIDQAINALKVLHKLST